MRVALKLKLLLLVVLLGFSTAQAQDVFSVGPAIHFNFGEKKPKVSWGVEAAVWWFEDQFPISGNLGFDRRRGSTVLYMQAQTGVGVAGISAGPYLELRKEDSPVLGLQTDYWLNYYAGLNYRVRYSGEGNQKALGFYLKAPLSVGGDVEDEDEDDWDWDWD
ncbi:hypothetical protein CLV24_12213 [Pontibacter ummariensis]|uniref:Outer membrane protein beta-barrel domain-containing protein n=2 Tax=Pontibacter ummariensis TaxID=1610492 RepID=A0A239JHU7_9BACT|nr:hypothetical protein [Pontibacter ummariensis]PRY07823.1 hypothetical protein CLV24_12213 [Pontibacter ummariensis]SNT05405.1 hypothetical protein SAMN06296052_12213 [Pontibacter ummariensis]